MAEPDSSAALSVVLVDDEPDLLLVLERRLSKHGLEVVGTAENGKDGIQLASEKQPDIVVLDLAMPGVDGETALPRIVKQAPKTMIAVLSAHLDPERAERLLGRGAFAAYEKGDLAEVPVALREDFRQFQDVLDGIDDVPAWHRRYRQF